MASGKKGKKTKGKTLALTDFLQETTGSLPTQPIRKSTTNWADEVDDFDALDSKIINVVLPTAPKASRDYDDVASNIPKDPPYSAYLSNLPYEVDEDEIADFFRNLKIVHLRLPREERPGEPPRMKGYGYVEFEDRDSLVAALILPDTTIKNRRIRIEVADPENDRRRGRMGDRMGSADTTGDWRSTNRPEPMDDRRFNKDREGGGGFTREGGRDREHFNRNREQEDRSGSWRDSERPTSFNTDRGFSRNYRDSDRNSRFDREDRDDRRGGFRRYDDNERNGSSINRDDRESQAPRSEPRQRPKLNLAPRTKPLDQSVVKPGPAVPAASIFGNAKPVDTTERERQIEEKLLRQQEERLRESSKDRDRDNRDSSGDRRNYERGRPLIRREHRDSESSNRGDKETNNRDRGPPSVERRNLSSDDNRKSGNTRSDHRSPDKTKKVEKQDKPKREEKRDRPEKELPKLQETEIPNFQGSNKFALLDESE